MIAGDPDPLAATHQGEQLFLIEAGHSPCPAIVVKTVTKTEYGGRAKIVDHRSQPVERRAGVVGRKQTSAPRRRRPLLQVKVRNYQQVQVGQEKRAARIAQRNLTGDSDFAGARY